MTRLQNSFVCLIIISAFSIPFVSSAQECKDDRFDYFSLNDQLGNLKDYIDFGYCKQVRDNKQSQEITIAIRKSEKAAEKVMIHFNIEFTSTEGRTTTVDADINFEKDEYSRKGFGKNAHPKLQFTADKGLCTECPVVDIQFITVKELELQFLAGPRKDEIITRKVNGSSTGSVPAPSTTATAVQKATAPAVPSPVKEIPAVKTPDAPAPSVSKDNKEDVKAKELAEKQKAKELKEKEENDKKLKEKEAKDQKAKEALEQEAKAKEAKAAGAKDALSSEAKEKEARDAKAKAEADAFQKEKEEKQQKLKAEQDAKQKEKEMKAQLAQEEKDKKKKEKENKDKPKDSDKKNTESTTAKNTSSPDKKTAEPVAMNSPATPPAKAEAATPSSPAPAPVEPPSAPTPPPPAVNPIPFPKEEYEEKSKDKVNQLQVYIQRISDKKNSINLTNTTIEQCLKLFVNNGEDAIVGVSSLTSDVVRKTKVKDYLTNLSRLPYQKVEITWSELFLVDNFKLGPDGNYHATISFEQTFKGFNDNNMVYGDVTRKNIEIYVKPYMKLEEGTMKSFWDILLGDIRVSQTQTLK